MVPHWYSYRPVPGDSGVSRSRGGLLVRFFWSKSAVPHWYSSELVPGDSGVSPSRGGLLVRFLWSKVRYLTYHTGIRYIARDRSLVIQVCLDNVCLDNVTLLKTGNPL